MSNWKVLALVIFTLSATELHAQDASNHTVLSGDWLIRLGGQQTDANVKAGLANSELGEIPVIDLSAGNANTTVTSFWTNITWQAPERWSLGFSYFQAQAETESITESDFTFGDLEIPAGTGITSDFETDFYVLNGYYDFFQSSNQAAGIGLGLYVLDLSISAQALVGSAPSGSTEAADTLAPLPTISAYYKHAFNDKLAFRANTGWLSADISDYDGSIFAADISIEYWPRATWGFGAGYTYVDLDLTVDKPVFDQLYEVQYDSFYGFFTWGF